MAALLACALGAVGCKSNASAGGNPPVAAPAQLDEKTPGAFVAAIEKNGRYRLYRVLAADDLPPPVGTELHLLAYDATAANFDEAAELAKGAIRATPQHEALRPLYEHLPLRLVDFATRERKVVGWAPLSKADLAQFEKDKALAQ